MAVSPREMTVQPSPSMVGSPSVGPAPVNAQARRFVPFRLATLERSELIGSDQVTMTANEQVLERVIEATGYVYGLDLDVNCVTSGNSANVAYVEDAPYSTISSLIFKDVTGELVNLDGFSAELLARYGRWKPTVQEGSSDTTVWQKTTGTGGTGGSFRFHLYVPVALNRRNLIALLGNQDRAQQYTLRHNIAGSGAVYGTGPTALGTVTINRFYESYAVPNAVNDSGIPNQVVPGHYGTLHFLTKTRSEAAPNGGSVVNHFLRRIGNTVRLFILVLRSNGTRASAESNLPTNVIFKIGNQTIFNESVAYRRQLMYTRYGFDAPSGVLVYDALHDFGSAAGAELGHDWFWTQNITLAQFQITYPSGFGSTNNSLDVLTSDLIVPAGAQIYGQ